MNLFSFQEYHLPPARRMRAFREKNNRFFNSVQNGLYVNENGLNHISGSSGQPDRRDTGDETQLRAESDVYEAHLYEIGAHP